MSVDWTKPIEAVHEDGRTEAMEFDGFGNDGQPETNGSPSDGKSNRYWWTNGRDRCTSGWRIRNVAKSVRTAADMLERMEALVRRATNSPDRIIGEEARAIVAEMTPPVDKLEYVIQQALDNGNDITAYEIAEAVRNSGLVT
jgi:hypothetical protein